MESTSVGAGSSTRPVTGDVVGKTNTIAFREYLKKRKLYNVLGDSDLRIFVIHSKFSRKLSKERIMKQIISDTKVIGKFFDIFPFRNTTTVFTNIGTSDHVLELFANNTSCRDKIMDFYSKKKDNKITIEGHTLSIQKGSVYANDIKEKLSSKRLVIKGVPFDCVEAFVDLVLTKYAIVGDKLDDFLYSADGTLTVLVKDFKAPVERVLDVNMNGFTVRAQVDTTGWTQAEVTRFMGKLNKPRFKVKSFTEVENVWSAGPIASQKPVQCWFCKQPGHAKPDCVQWIDWIEKLQNKKCFKCGENGHVKRFCKNEALSRRERIARKHKDDICRKCKEKGHLEVHNLCKNEDMSVEEIDAAAPVVQQPMNQSLIEGLNRLGVLEGDVETSSVKSGKKRGRDSPDKSKSKNNMKNKAPKMKADQSRIDSDQNESSETISEEEPDDTMNKSEDLPMGMFKQLLSVAKPPPAFKITELDSDLEKNSEKNSTDSLTAGTTSLVVRDRLGVLLQAYQREVIAK